MVLTGENGNAARRRDGQEHGGLVLAVLLGDARLVVVEHWDEPRRDELARLPACAHHRQRVSCISARSSDITVVYESYDILSIVIYIRDWCRVIRYAKTLSCMRLGCVTEAEYRYY